MIGLINDGGYLRIGEEKRDKKEGFLFTLFVSIKNYNFIFFRF